MATITITKMNSERGFFGRPYWYLVVGDDIREAGTAFTEAGAAAKAKRALRRAIERNRAYRPAEVVYKGEYDG